MTAPISAPTDSFTGPQPTQPMPRWDRNTRRLWLGDVLVLSFDRPAPCQELILAAFQEESWEERIDSPVPGGKGEYQRLRNAVKRLNAQLDPYLRFHLDGTGDGVFWQLALLQQELRRRLEMTQGDPIGPNVTQRKA